MYSSHTADYGNTQVDITELSGENGQPVLYTAQKIPSNVVNPLYGFGATKIEAVVDLFRVYRNKYGIIPGKSPG